VDKAEGRIHHDQASDGVIRWMRFAYPPYTSASFIFRSDEAFYLELNLNLARLRLKPTRHDAVLVKRS